MTLSIFIHTPGTPLEQHDSFDALKHRPDNSRVWVDLETEDPKLMAEVAKTFGLHELAIEDCLTPGHFPKIETHESYTFMVLRCLKPISVVEDIWKALSSTLEESDDTITRLAEKIKENEEEGKLTRKIAIFFSEKFIITYRRRSIDWLHALIEHMIRPDQQYLSAGTDVVAHKIIDVLTDRFLRAMSFFDSLIDKMEDSAIVSIEEFSMSQVLEMKRALVWLKHIIRDQRQVVTRLAHDPSIQVSSERRRYFKDIEDHISETDTILENALDSLSGVRDAYFASVNVRLNDTMRILAIITTIAAPLNVMVGMYGMNFSYMPLLHHRFGFWAMAASMIAMCILMLFYFRKKRWL